MCSSESPSVVVGIDVSKAQLDVHLWPDGVAQRFDNTASGVIRLTKYLNTHAVTLIVCEAAGR